MGAKSATSLPACAERMAGYGAADFGRLLGEEAESAAKENASRFALLAVITCRSGVPGHDETAVQHLQLDPDLPVASIVEPHAADSPWLVREDLELDQIPALVVKLYRSKSAQIPLC